MKVVYSHGNFQSQLPFMKVVYGTNILRTARTDLNVDVWHMRNGRKNVMVYVTSGE